MSYVQGFQKLKGTKKVLRELNKLGFDNVEVDATKVREESEAAQNAMSFNPIESIARDTIARQSFNRANKTMQSLLHQKSKLAWLKYGDENTKVFFQAIKA